MRCDAMEAPEMRDRRGIPRGEADFVPIKSSFSCLKSRNPSERALVAADRAAAEQPK